MRDAFARALYEIAHEDPKIFIVVGDISPAGSMAPFREKFPDRFVNAGVAEQVMIGTCAGLALRGFNAFAYTIAPFTIYRPFEQVRDDLCYQNLPVTLVGVGAGVAYSTLGGTHHSQEDIALMSALPNMSIIAPCDPLETTAATWASARHTGPLYLRIGKSGEPDLTSEAIDSFEFGKIRFIRDGKDVCVISYGPITAMASEAALRIEEEHGHPVALVSAHTLKPLDVVGIARIFNRFDTVVVIEEHSERGGLGSQVKQLAWENGARCEIHTFGLKDEFIHVFGTQLDLWHAHGLSVENISKRVLGY